MAAIRERQHYQQWRDEQWLIWQTRTLATFVAATVPVEKEGDASPLLDEAQRIGLTDSQAQTQKNTTREPGTGSFERFMGSFGNPRRWGPQ